MSVYNTGSATITVGSATVTGNATRWDLYAATNYLFKERDTATVYSITSVVSSCELTLSARYADSNNQTTQADEHLATVVHSATGISGRTTDNNPVIANTVYVTASTAKWEDDGGGVLSTVAGAGLGDDGTIDYDTGAYTITFTATTNIATDVAITASYDSGDTLTAMPYQIVTGYTTNYDFPELTTNTANIENIYTKAVRLIDSAIYTASVGTITVASHIKLGANQYIFFGAEDNEASVVAAATSVCSTPIGSTYMSTAGALWVYDGNTTATKVSLT